MGTLIRRAIATGRLRVRGKVQIETRDTPMYLTADGEVIDLDFRSELLSALGTTKGMRLRGDIRLTATGTVRVLNIEGRVAASVNIETIRSIEIEHYTKGGCTITEFSGLRIKVETGSGDTITNLFGIDMEFALSSGATRSAGIMMKSTAGQVVKYGIDMQGGDKTYPLTPSEADIRLGMADIEILSGAGAPTMSAPQGSLYLRTNGSGTTNRAYINTDGGTTWTAITTSA